jgi:hypothetical protein
MADTSVWGDAHTAGLLWLRYGAQVGMACIGDSTHRDREEGQWQVIRTIAFSGNGVRHGRYH